MKIAEIANFGPVIYISDIYHKIRYFFLDLTQGIKNFWFYRKVIYRDRWWDYTFFLDILEKKLQNLDDNWDKSIGYFSKDTHKEIKEMLSYIKEIRHYEDQYDDSNSDVYPYLPHAAASQRILVLYTQLGEKLFSERDFVIKVIHKKEGEDIVKESGTVRNNLFTQLWD